MKIKKVLLLGGTHGDEKLGIDLVKKIKKKPLSFLDSIIVNYKAVKENKRYIETDINRTAGKKYPISFEEIRAKEIQKRFKKYNLIIDIHASVTDGTFCGIVVDKIYKIQLEIIKYFGFSFVVIMPKEGALITPAGKKAVGLEISKNKSQKYNIDFLYNKLKNINNFKNNKKKKIKVFKYINSVPQKTLRNIKKDFGNIKNFKRLNKKQLDLLKLPNNKKFYPIFFGEGAYVDTAFVLVEFKKEVFI